LTFQKEFSDEAFFNALSSTEFKSTHEIAIIVGCSNRLVELRLATLEESDKVIKGTEPTRGRFKFRYIWKLKEKS
jgi:hypothetical protein